jgi:hypothetical protein
VTKYIAVVVVDILIPDGFLRQFMYLLAYRTFLESPKFIFLDYEKGSLVPLQIKEN